jgi:peptidoglycan/LPS O-acetylase OafA/YrhL
MSRSSIALSNLRAVVILIVLAFHSVLAYLASLPAEAYRFDTAPYRWQAIPIVDSERWFGFDLFCAWQDISLMSLMFFLSGLFVPLSLKRKGSGTFLSDRFFRIGLPLILVVMLLMPIAYYPTYLATAADPGISAYWQHWLALPFWPCGPQWFLWLLLTLNVLAAGMHRFAPAWGESLGRLAGSARLHPVRFFIGLVLVSGLAYIPLALLYSPWQWASFGPFSVQLARPLHYLVYFLAGLAVGAHGLDRGLLASDGALARNWAAWLAASIVGFVLWALPTSLMVDGQTASMPVQFASGIGFVLACASGCFVLLALCLRFAQQRTRILDSLAGHAYSMYLLHYIFVVWLQYALLPLALFAAGKAAIVFGGTLVLSWAAAVAVNDLLASQFISAKQWVRANVGDPAPSKVLKQDDLTG